MNEPPREILAARAGAEEVVSRETVLKAIDQTAIRLDLALHDENPLLVCVLQGAIAFTGALLQRLHFPLQLTSVHVGRYSDHTHGGELNWFARPTIALADRHVVLIDDVLDRGITLAALKSWALAQGAAKVTIVVLVDKQVNTEREISADFTVLECPDRFLFGWGMDYRGYWRNLPAIYAIAEEQTRQEDSA